VASTGIATKTPVRGVATAEGGRAVRLDASTLVGGLLEEHVVV
jgi:hypothetical protein